MAWTAESRKKAAESKKKTGRTNQFTAGSATSMSEQTKEKLRISSTGKKHTEESKRLMSEKALASKHRRLKKGTVWYKGVLLDSSWELAMAERLDELNIMWIRPDPVEWVDQCGKTRNYFPDFYLPEHDIYLDPKNPQAYRSQKHKIECLKKQLTNLIIIGTIQEIKNWSLGTTGLAQSPSKR